MNLFALVIFYGVKGLVLSEHCHVCSEGPLLALLGFLFSGSVLACTRALIASSLSFYSHAVVLPHAAWSGWIIAVLKWDAADSKNYKKKN